MIFFSFNFHTTLNVWSPTFLIYLFLTVDFSLPMLSYFWLHLSLFKEERSPYTKVSLVVKNSFSVCLSEKFLLHFNSD